MMMNGARIRFFGVLLCVTLGALGCSRRGVAPKEFQTVDEFPAIYPDYLETTVPPNIAPMNFRILANGESYATRFTGKNGKEFTVSGRDVIIPEKAWRELLSTNKGASFSVDVFVRQNGNWRKYNSFENEISLDPIDGYVAYRLIEPGYDYAHRIALAQRSLESFDEQLFFDNRFVSSSPCVNCHSFQDRKTDKFLFHYRRTDDPAYGGTIVVNGKSATKVSGKVKSAGISCSYPSWNPTSDVVAFSTNQTRQVFHSLSSQKLEVYDVFSDLVVFDASKNALSVVERTPCLLETFPSWSPDGKTLFYCVAEVKSEELRESLEKSYLAESIAGDVNALHLLTEAMSKNATEIRYDIMSRSFDEVAKSFGEPQPVVSVSTQGKTALFPRVSPDGAFLAYTCAESGTFPIWRPEADLYLKDLRTGDERRWDEVNSDDSDSYHTWSSNGRWLVLSSRREDGQYTRLYFAHVDESGRASKPFVLPQRDPQHNLHRFKSYNVPELIVEPVKIDLRTLYQAAKNDPNETENLERL